MEFVYGICPPEKNIKGGKALEFDSPNVKFSYQSHHTPIHYSCHTRSIIHAIPLYHSCHTRTIIHVIPGSTGYLNLSSPAITNSDKYCLNRLIVSTNWFFSIYLNRYETYSSSIRSVVTSCGGDIKSGITIPICRFKDMKFDP